MAITAVVFDVGNVLIQWQPEIYYDRVFGESRREALFNALDLHAMNEQVDLGAPWKDTVYGFAEANPEWREEILHWHDHWIEIASPAIDQSVRLLRALRAKGTPVFVLSNFGVQNWPVAVAKYPFMAEFDREYVSGRLKVQKPDPRIYEIVEQDSGHAPQGLLFADDRLDNIEAAAARGWNVHHFTGAQGWADRLVSEGLLTAEEAR